MSLFAWHCTDLTVIRQDGFNHLADYGCSLSAYDPLTQYGKGVHGYAWHTETFRTFGLLSSSKPLVPSIHGAVSQPSYR